MDCVQGSNDCIIMDTCNWILGHLGVGLLLVGVQVSTGEKDSLPEENFCYLPQDGMS